MRFPRGRKNALIAFLLLVGVAVAVGLIVTGGEDSSPTPDPVTTTTTQDSTPPLSAAPDVTLPLTELSAAAVTELTGLVFPTDMTDFLTSTLEGNTQLDVTFVAPIESAGAFLEASGLPAPTPDERLVTHSSPLWTLNPDPGTTLSSSQDDYGDVHRVVELIGDGGQTIRTRIVITPI